ncbi:MULTISPECIES: FAD-binding protein [unclassified Paracoccus (in: a-proteobacteria)]|uniref:FAD-binding protein n=1 Tax=unclassified Paracoccus (in: a-proteobacteria) TaxID=2688777 RepID=UPI0012B2B0E4|nr:MULTISPECIES: FAD-binding protein [unclassified Paracoccus (in: a-proteobacteria)]UXU74724.1 FAD-binding protein [Paracoccus sp. SMMA_5]UXU80620.1 FAD-binding protein [Paracoccus sp. SMMA_5_TC]
MRPETEAELAQIIRETRVPLSVTGGGSRLRPDEGQGQRLETTGLSGVVLYEPAALTVVVRAGTLLQDLQQILASEGQMLAFEPDLRPGSTIGGVAASNSSGPRRVLVGACRDAMLGVRFVDGRGQVISNGGRVMKNVTGYDLVKLMAGSRGTLGVLSEIALRTAPLPPCAVTLALPGLDAAAALPALTAALSGPFDVSGAGWLPDAGVLLRLEGLPVSVRERRRALTDRLAPFGSLIESDAALWPRLVPRMAQGDLWRVICRPSEAPALLAHLPQVLAMDWGGALIWADLPAGQAPDLPPWSGHATRVTGDHAMTLPATAPLVARLNDSLRRRFDPRALFQGGA